MLTRDVGVALDQRVTAGLDVKRGAASQKLRVQVAGHVVERQLNVLVGAAVLDACDHVLGDVDQAPGQVARVRRTQRRVGKTLTGAVRRDEVLEHVETLDEVGLDRALDDLALRIGHEAAHARELADLLERSARTRAGHHVDRVQRVAFLDVLDHRVGDLVGRLVPEVGHLEVTLFFGDQAVLVLLLDFGDPAVVGLEDLALARRHDHVVLGDRHPSLGGVVEAQVLEGVKDFGDGRRAERLDQVVDELDGVALAQRLVDEAVIVLVEALAQRFFQSPLDAVVEDDAPNGGQYVTARLAVRTELGDIVQLHDAVLVGELGFLRRPEHVRPLTGAVGAGRLQALLKRKQIVFLGPVGEVVGTEDHVLGRRGQRCAMGRRQDVVRRQHQDPRLGLGFG